MAGLPVWLLRPSTACDSPTRCNILEIVTPLKPDDVLCVSENYLPFPAIFYGSETDPKKTWCNLYSFMNVAGVQRPIWEFKGLVNPILAQHIFPLLLKL